MASKQPESIGASANSVGDTQPTPDASSSNSSALLSKNAQKKAAKAARFAAQKLERRAKEKEAKKKKKRIKAQKRAAGELEEDEIHEEEEKKRVMKRVKTGAGQKPFGARICVDLGFDEMMTDKEIISLCSQLGYVYSVNRRSACPFSSVLFTSCHGRTFTRLESMNNAAYKRWTSTEWWQEGYDQLWSGKEGEFANNEVEKADGGSRVAQESVIYLTADSDEELMELKEGETYIIGGICDHNRYKNLCLNKATESNIRTARLPIGRFLASLTTRKVLTVNQVFEILVKWVETRNWEEALYSVIPKRKFLDGGNTQEGDDGEEEELEDEEDEDRVNKLEDAGRKANTTEGVGSDRQQTST